MSAFELVEYKEIAEGVVIVRLNRPEKRNAFNDAMAREFGQAMTEFAVGAAKVAILTGTGVAFTAGRDVFENRASGKATLEPPDLAGVTNPFWTPVGGVRYERSLEKPVIGAINGFAFGTGVFLALAADICLASEQASFELSEIRRGHVGGWQVGYQYGLTRSAAMEMALGRRVSAQRAYDMGWVNEVTTAAELLPRALEWAKDIAALSADAVAAHRGLVDAVWPPVTDELDRRAEQLRHEIAGRIDLGGPTRDWASVTNA